MRNERGAASHWLTVSLRGTRSNRQGIGAVVTIVDNRGRTQSGVCSTASSYQSGNDARVHFGLGDATAVRRVEVRWPSRDLQVIQEVPVNRIVEVVYLLDSCSSRRPNHTSTPAFTKARTTLISTRVIIRGMAQPMPRPAP